MGKEAEKKPEENQTPPEENNQEESQKSLNAQAKELPWVRELAAKVASAERKEQERQAAEEKAARDKETKQLEDEKRYKEAADKKAQDAVADAREKWQADKKREDAINEAKMKLLLGGVKNEKFIKAELTDFNPDEQSPDDFAKSVLEHPDTEPFLSAGAGDIDTGEGATKPKGTPHGNKSQQSFSPAKLKEWSESSDPEKKKAAIAYKEAYWDKHNALPPEG